MTARRVDGKRLYLRDVRAADVTPRYVQWLNDPEINRFLEARFSKHTLESAAAYVAEMAASQDNAFFAIVLKDGDRHIGNLKIGPINRTHNFAEVGIVIGDKECWGKGYASEALALATRYSFESMNLHRLEAGYYGENLSSGKAFANAGWQVEATLRSKWLLDGRYVDGIRMSCIRGPR